MHPLLCSGWNFNFNLSAFSYQPRAIAFSAFIFNVPALPLAFGACRCRGKNSKRGSLLPSYNAMAVAFFACYNIRFRFCSQAITLWALLQPRNINCFCCTCCSLLQSDVQIVAQVISSLRPSSPPKPTAKEFVKNALKIKSSAHKIAEVKPAERLSLYSSGLVIPSPFLIIGKNRRSLIYLLKLIRCTCLLVQIRIVFLRQPFVCSLNFLFCSILVHAKYFIIILGHLTSSFSLCFLRLPCIQHPLPFLPLRTLL